MTTSASSSPPIENLPLEEKRALLARLLQSARREPLLSLTQERIWQLDQFQPGNPVYNFQSAIELKGELDSARLDAALARVVQRHEALRTRFDAEKGQPRLEILDEARATLLHDDWSEIAAPEQAERLRARAREDAGAGFELRAPPLFRLRLIRFGARHHVLLLTMHHIVSDVLSLEIFFDELGAFYGAAPTDDPPALAPLTATYQDFARFQRGHIETLERGPAVDHWRTHLAQAPLHEWLSDFPRPERPSQRAATVFFEIDAELLGRVEQLARAERATPFMVLLAAFYVLAHGASRREDIVVGSPTAGRLRAEYEPLIGMFSYPMAIRARVAPEDSFKELLRAVRQSALGAAEHMDLPFARVVELAQQAGAAPGPLVRLMFSYVSRLRPIDFAGLQVKRVPTDRGLSDFDWFLTIYRDAERWVGMFEYATDLFSGSTAESWGGTYADILRAAVESPHVGVGALAEKVKAQEPFRIALAATFTADALDDVVRHWSRELRYPIVVELAPYNQVFQELLDPNSLFHARTQRANVVLVRPQDWVRYQEDPAQRLATLQQSARDFIEAVRNHSARLPCPLYVYVCPASPDHAERDAVEAAEADILEGLSGVTGVEVGRAEVLAARYPVPEVHDAKTDEIGHVPFTPDWFIAFGSGLVRRLSRELRTPYKVLALDCDNTLWRGVCGEDGATGVRIDAPYHALQQFMTQLADSGMLLCLVSKNEEQDVRAVFERHPDMVLRWDRIVAQRVNWEPKSRNLRALADELQLGLDSFIFVDDNPIECAEVRAQCPEALTLELPSDPEEIPTFLEHVWAFDRGAASAEDRRRAESYRENREREALRRQHGSFAEFLGNLGLAVDIAAPEPAQRPRLAQLSQRTNQFNASGLRLDETGLARALRDGLQAFAVQVKDRFGDYGLVGAAFFRLEPERCVVEGFLLSCRVLGRGVEHRIVSAIAERAQAAGAATVDIVYRELPRNRPMLRFLRTLPGAFHDIGDGVRVFRLATAQASLVRFDPAAEAAEGTASTAEATETRARADGAQGERQLALATIARELRDVKAIAARMDSRARRRRKPPVAAEAPQSGTEEAIAEIWREVLKIDAIGRDDNFFDSGGNSLMLVQVNSRLMEQFARDIPIVDLFQYPTIATLAGHLGQSAASSGPKLEQSQARGDLARQNMQKRLRQWGALRGARGKPAAGAGASE